MKSSRDLFFSFSSISLSFLSNRKKNSSLLFSSSDRAVSKRFSSQGFLRVFNENFRTAILSNRFLLEFSKKKKKKKKFDQKDERNFLGSFLFLFRIKSIVQHFLFYPIRIRINSRVNTWKASFSASVTVRRHSTDHPIPVFRIH